MTRKAKADTMTTDTTPNTDPAAADHQAPAEGGADTAAEEAAHLARLNANATDADDPNGPHLADTAAEPFPSVNLAAEVSALLRVLVAMTAPIFPSLREVYTQETIEAVGAVVAPVCRKHGWLQNGIGGKYAEEMAALAVLAPVAVSTYAGITRDLAERKARQPKEPEQLPDLTADAPRATVATPEPERRVTFGAQLPEAVAA